MTQENDLPSQETVGRVLAVIAPSYAGFTVQSLAGSYSNHTYLVNVEFADRPAQRIVLRRYNEDNGDCPGKARREFHALAHLQTQNIPSPKPLYLDDDGKLLGSPGIITGFVTGRQIEVPDEPDRWASSIMLVAQMLARIHATPYDETLKPHLMDGNRGVTWFLGSGTVPRFMERYPGGAAVWQTVSDLLPGRTPVAPALLHIDYWSGNILWHEGQISAVVDWEEAAFGDPGIDVAYCRMQLYLEGLDEAADTFLRVYEQESGQKVANLGLWELAASARPMTDPEGWLERPFMRERFERFIADAKARR